VPLHSTYLKHDHFFGVPPEVWLERIGRANAESRLRRCTTCGSRPVVHCFGLQSPPVVMVMELSIERGVCPSAPIPEEFVLGSHTYRVSGCTYGDGSHFTAVVKCFDTKKLYDQDGMENNGKWMDRKDTVFPLFSQGRVVNDVVYLRSDHCV
jgi:hypothetical protein